MSDSTPVAAADQQVLITRIFDAPREQVFRAWTDPDEVAAWFGPAQMETPRDRMTLSDSPQPAAGRSHAEAGWNAALDKLAARVAR
jgi:uncharacterized protein YndB with AHSA1/START domain